MTDNATAGSPELVTTLSISSAIVSISGSPIPRVVTAGVPMRMPLVTNGDCVSFGTVFLFTVIAALVERLLAPPCR